MFTMRFSGGPPAINPQYSLYPGFLCLFINSSGAVVGPAAAAAAAARQTSARYIDTNTSSGQN